MQTVLRNIRSIISTLEQQPLHVRRSLHTVLAAGITILIIVSYVGVSFFVTPKIATKTTQNNVESPFTLIQTKMSGLFANVGNAFK